MNFGTNKEKAVKQAKANVRSSKKPWRLFMWSGVWWVEPKTDADKAIEGEEVFYPKGQIPVDDETEVADA